MDDNMPSTNSIGKCLKCGNIRPLKGTCCDVCEDCFNQYKTLYNQKCIELNLPLVDDSKFVFSLKVETKTKFKNWRVYYLRNRDRIRAYQKKYDKTPSGKLLCSRRAHKRRSREFKTESTLTLNQWNKILETQGNKCTICGKRFNKSNPATKDHIIPVSKGGGLTFENVQALCRSCNSSKSNRIDYSLIVSYGIFDQCSVKQGT